MLSCTSASCISFRQLTCKHAVQPLWQASLWAHCWVQCPQGTLQLSLRHTLWLLRTDGCSCANPQLAVQLYVCILTATLGHVQVHSLCPITAIQLYMISLQSKLLRNYKQQQLICIVALVTSCVPKGLNAALAKPHIPQDAFTGCFYRMLL